MALLKSYRSAAPIRLKSLSTLARPRTRRAPNVPSTRRKRFPERPTISEQFHNNTSVSSAKMLVRGSAWASPPERKMHRDRADRARGSEPQFHNKTSVTKKLVRVAPGLVRRENETSRKRKERRRRSNRVGGTCSGPIMAASFMRKFGRSSTWATRRPSVVLVGIVGI